MFAAVCVLLSATGHILMAGRGVAGWALGLAFAGTCATAWVLADRERGLAAVTTAAVAVQTVLHTVFSWSATGMVGTTAGVGPAPTSPTDHLASMADMAHMAHMDHTAHMSHMGHLGHSPMDMATDMGLSMGMSAGMGMPGMPEAAVGHHVMTDTSTGLGMLAAHLLAALLSGLWLAYGERAAFRVLRALPAARFSPARFLRLLLALVAVPPVPDRPRPRPARAADERAPRRLLFAHAVISRGPPPALAVT
ncbi:hypothetical protein ACIGO8_09915 [Streptomyces sp. NPDC053493]|uniref:hypothetical protein n=1 Tax=Streptomyces sp. NPDC053493 TaxID=3365705 RepID=UPI0037D12A86